MQNLLHIFQVHNRVVRSRDLVSRTCHAVLRVDSSRNREKFEKSVWLQTLIIFSFFRSDYFSTRRNRFRVNERICEQRSERINVESKHSWDDLWFFHEV
jgi:hypothetical protein